MIIITPLLRLSKASVCVCEFACLLSPVSWNHVELLSLQSYKNLWEVWENSSTASHHDLPTVHRTQVEVLLCLSRYITSSTFGRDAEPLSHLRSCILFRQHRREAALRQKVVPSALPVLLCRDWTEVNFLCWGDFSGDEAALLYLYIIRFRY